MVPPTAVRTTSSRQEHFLPPGQTCWEQALLSPQASAHGDGVGGCQHDFLRHSFKALNNITEDENYSQVNSLNPPCYTQSKSQFATGVDVSLTLILLSS